MKKLGVINFSWSYKKDVLEVNIFKVYDFSGIPTESEEMKPEWFLIKDIPYEKMWSDDKYWIPLFLENKIFKAKFIFDDKDNVLNYKLKEVKEI